MSIPPRNNKKERFSPESQPPSPSPNHKPNIAFSSSYPWVADNFSSPPSMEPLVFPLGYKFEPTDEDVLYYLNGFLQGNKGILHNVPIHRVNIYESTPQQLSKEYDKGNDKEWFFITQRTKKSEGGTRQIRKDNGGYWKNQAAKRIEAGHGVVGYRSALAYFTGGKENSVKSDWLMHEYWFESNGDNEKVDHALCKIYLTPKRGKRRAEEAGNGKKKMKIEEALEEEVDQPLNVAFQDSSLPEQQPHNYAYKPQQKLHNVAYEPHQPELDLSTINFELPNVIPDDVAGYFGNFSPHLLDGDEESSNRGYIQRIREDAK